MGNLILIIMIEVARAIGGISLNGKEWLLDENGNIMQFKNREIAYNFLKMNGFDNFSNDELEDSFIINELD